MKTHPAKRLYIIRTGITSVLLLSVYGLILFQIFRWQKIELLIPVLPVFLVANRFFAAWNYNRTFLPLLTRDLDPESYRAATFSFRTVPVSCRLNYALFTGDYRTAINLCTAAMRSTKSSAVKLGYLRILCRIDLELGDREKLAEVCEEMDRLNKKTGKGKKQKKIADFQSVCHLYAKGEDQRAIELQKEILDRLNPKSSSYTFQRVNALFHMAQIIYRSGDPKSAAPLFEQVMQIAPKLNLAESSRICLEAIQKEESAPEPPEILPDPNYPLRPPAEEAICGGTTESATPCSARCFCSCWSGLSSRPFFKRNRFKIFGFPESFRIVHVVFTTGR